MESPRKDYLVGGGESNDVGRAFNHRDEQEHKHEQQHHNSQPLTGDGASPGKIFTGGLARETTIAQFIKHFGKYGEITDSVIMKDRKTGQPRGFGFITFADPLVVDKVIEDPHVIIGKQMNLETFSHAMEKSNLEIYVVSLVNCLSLSLLFIGNSGLCGNWLNYPCQCSHPTDRGRLNFPWELCLKGAIVLRCDFSEYFLYNALQKNDILSNSIQTRSKAHQIIKRMLVSLGDPYTRFLSPNEFSKMARYDMAGIGINLREVTEDNGDHRLKVLGLILDGPTYYAGVRQEDEILVANNMEVKGKSTFEVSSLLQGPNGTSITIQVLDFDSKSSVETVDLLNQ